MIDELVPREDLLEHAMGVAARLGARPKAAVAACKRAVYEGGSLPLADGLRVERNEFMATLGTRGAEDAMAAYQDALERTGELPGYDREMLERALRSRALQRLTLPPIATPALGFTRLPLGGG